jgi:hypothetical protein
MEKETTIPYLTSPFSYYGGEFNIVATEEHMDLQIKGNEAAVLRALAKYKVLNARCIAAVVAQMMPQDRRKSSYEKELDLLYRADYIIKYQYPQEKIVKSNDEQEDNAVTRGNTVLYALSAKGIAYADSKKIKVGLRSEEPENTPVYSTAEALEQAELNTWHIRMLETSSDIIQMELYDYLTRVEYGVNAVIPSCIQIKHRKGDGFILRSLTVAAVPLAKMEDLNTEGHFLNRLLAVNSFLRQNERNLRNAFIVILVDSFMAAEKAYTMLQAYTPLDDLHVLFALDEFVMEVEPITHLIKIDIDPENGDIVHSLVNLCIKKEEAAVQQKKKDTKKEKESKEEE